MSSDVMIICKEFNNFYSGRLQNLELVKPQKEAMFIDEASMGESWSEFGKWFVERYYQGMTMVEKVMIAGSGIQEETFMGREFLETDFESIKIALKNLKTHKDFDKSKVLAYLQECIGKHISTENW